jgi:hypothetical protein
VKGSKMELKLNDVYKFRYNEDYIKNNSYPYHCFDGQLIVKQKSDGSLYLEDTYWSCGDNKWFTLEKALKQGTLEFICNLEDVEKCDRDDYKYYNEDDIFDLSYQSGCYARYRKKKGAVRSAEVMRRTIKRGIEKAQSDIQWAERQIERGNEYLEKLKNGETEFNIYL